MVASIVGGVGGVWVAYCCFDASASQKSSAFGLTTFRKVPKGPESGIFLPPQPLFAVGEFGVRLATAESSQLTCIK